MDVQSARIAIATAAEVADLDEEGQLLARCLREQGVEVRPEVWDDDAVAWADYQLVVIRSTWDYPTRREAFLEWAQRVAQRAELVNPPQMLRWTTDKLYLRDLEETGVPTVRYLFISPADDRRHSLLDVEHVVKPTISAGSKDTLRLSGADQDRSLAHIRSIQESGRTALVQPYLDTVDEHGETALIYIDGRFSHAIRKAAILEPDAELVEGLYAEEEISSREATDLELDVGAQALAVVPAAAEAPPLYARIDLLPSNTGPQVLEVELAEPSLFLQHHGPAATTLATAIHNRLLAT